MFNQHQLDAIALTTRISSSLGIIGALSALLLFIYNRSHFNTPVGRLVLCTATADLLDASFKLIGTSGPSAGVDSLLCQLQGTGIQYGTLVAILCSVTLASWSVYLTFFNGSADSIVSRQHIYIAAVFILPLPATLYPLLADPRTYGDGTRMMGDTQIWCWITSDFFAYQLVLFYVWLWICYVAITAASVLTYIHLRRNTQSTAVFLIQRMGVYMLAFLVAWSFSTINRVTSITYGNVYVLSLLQAFFSPARGMWNFGAFAYTWRYSPERIQREKMASISAA
jgi:Slime mold cyclic AMP receptor